MPGRSRNEGFGAARAKEARERGINDTPRDKILRAEKISRRFHMLDQQHAFGADPAGKPSRKAITCHVPGPWNVLCTKHHSGCGPDRHPAVEQHAADSSCRRRRSKPPSETRECAAI